MITNSDYPRMLFHSVENPIVVQTEQEYAEKIAHGWSKTPVEFDTIANLKSQIEYHQQEYVRLRGELDMLIGEPSPEVPKLVEEPVEPIVGAFEEIVESVTLSEFKESPEIGRVIDRNSEDVATLTIKEDEEPPVVSRRGRKPKE